jgi:hypothetical protein
MSDVTPNKTWRDAVSVTRGMKATWPIDTELAVGTFGTINSDGSFVRRGTLENDFGILIDTAVHDRQDVLAWASEGVSSTSGLAQADAGQLTNVVAAGNIDVHLSFQRAGAIAYRFEGTSIVIPRDQSSLQDSIRELARQKNGYRRLDIGTVVVTQVTRARRGFVLISSARDASAGLSVTAKLAPIKLELASVGAGFKLASHSDGLLPFVGRKLTPFFRGYLINRRWGGFQPKAHAYGYTGIQIAEVYLADVVTSEWIRGVEFEDLPGRSRANVDFEKLDWSDEYYLPDN